MPGKVEVIELAQNEEYQPLLEGRPQTCGMRAGRVYLEEGQSCGAHSTEAHEETLVFLAVRGTASIDGKDGKAVGKGKVLYIPPHTLHNITNSGDEPLVYIYCVAPASE